MNCDAVSRRLIWSRWPAGQTRIALAEPKKIFHTTGRDAEDIRHDG